MKCVDSLCDLLLQTPVQRRIMVCNKNFKKHHAQRELKIHLKGIFWFDQFFSTWLRPKLHTSLFFVFYLHVWYSILQKWSLSMVCVYFMTHTQWCYNKLFTCIYLRCLCQLHQNLPGWEPGNSDWTFYYGLLNEKKTTSVTLNGDRWQCEGTTGVHTLCNGVVISVVQLMSRNKSLQWVGSSSLTLRNNTAAINTND